MKQVCLWISIGCILSGIMGCGQSGKLYLPNQCWNQNMTPNEVQPKEMSIDGVRCDTCRGYV